MQATGAYVYADRSRIIHRSRPVNSDTEAGLKMPTAHVALQDPKTPRTSRIYYPLKGSKLERMRWDYFSVTPVKTLKRNAKVVADVWQDPVVVEQRYV